MKSNLCWETRPRHAVHVSSRWLCLWRSMALCDEDMRDEILNWIEQCDQLSKAENDTVIGSWWWRVWCCDYLPCTFVCLQVMCARKAFYVWQRLFYFLVSVGCILYGFVVFMQVSWWMSNKKMEAMQRIKRGAVWEFGHRIFCKLLGIKRR